MKRSGWKWKDHPMAHPGEDGRYVVYRWNYELQRGEYWRYGSGWDDVGPASEFGVDAPIVSWEKTWCDPIAGCGVAPNRSGS